jgi:hypothetical protein
LRKYFDRLTAEHIQDEVLFTPLYTLGERGQERLKYLKKKGTLVGVDADRQPYLSLLDLPTKNQSTDPTPF